MPVRKDYPIPDCPKCGKRDNRVLNTYYTEDQDIVRHRECNFCAHRLYTSQPPELLLPSDTYRVIIPKYHKGKNLVTVRHKSEDIEYRERQAKLDDQQKSDRRNQFIKNAMQRTRR